MKYQKYVIVILISIAAMLQGCAIVKTIKIDPIPELKIGSPLAGIKSLTFKINDFEDVRPSKNVILARNDGRLELHEDQKVSEIIAQAIANELKRNGHKILRSGEAGKADVIIDGIVRGYWIQLDSYMFKIKITGMVETEINVTTKQNTDKPLTKTYRGEYYYETSGLPSSSLYRDIINQALIEMLKEFTTDEEFLNTIKQVRKQGS